MTGRGIERTSSAPAEKRRRVKLRLWPWSELSYLRRELRAVRLSDSASKKKVNRLTARIRVLDGACSKHHRQAAHDQAYIDLLEAALPPLKVVALRERLRRVAVSGVPEGEPTPGAPDENQSGAGGEQP